MELQRLAINQITTPRWSLAEAVQGYARQGVGGIGIWRDKLAECGLRQARRLLHDSGLQVPTLCKAGDLAMLDAQGPHAALDDCRRAIDEAAEIGAATVVFVGGGMGTHPSLCAARGRLHDVLQDACAHAAQAGVSLGIEPFHPMHAAERGCVNTLGQAHRLRDALGPAASVVLDVFHCWWDPELDRYLAPSYLPSVSTVQLCDWRVPTRHPVTDRAMIGDGAADVAGMVHRLEANGYRGPYEIEIFSTDWWARDPTDVTRICVQRYASLAHA
ncbi:MAG TPA: sugar phosphate isomerase/epimerase family protein [Bordetella sp.]|nr:sugar phosphate isomerase/epimerase family protein [Bordetella sp.]